MCRARKAENRRCECDTSEARQERRKNAEARLKNLPVVNNTTPDYSLPLIPRESPASIDDIQEEINNLNEARALLKPLLMSSKRSNNGYFPTYDKILNRLGANIENFAETQYGAPTDNQLQVAMYPFMTGKYYENTLEAIKAGKAPHKAHETAQTQLYYSDAWPQVKETVGRLLEVRNEAYRNALRDAGVIFADPDSLKYAEESSDEAAVKSVKNALYFYPQSWVDSSNETHLKELPFVIKSTLSPNERAEYARRKQDYDNDYNFLDVTRLTVSKDSRFMIGSNPSMRPALHEFAHRIQHTVKGIPRHEKYFLNRRAGYFVDDGIPPEKPSLIYPDLYQERNIFDEDQDKVKNTEEGIRDNFPNHYMGKIQCGGADEILSMGMETLFGGTNGAFAGILRTKADSDYKKFMLGILASSVNDKFYT